MSNKKFNPIAASIIFLAVILILIFADKILVNLSAAFLIVGLPVYYYFINNPQQVIGYLIFIVALTYLNVWSSKDDKRLKAMYDEYLPEYQLQQKVGELDDWMAGQKYFKARQYMKYLALSFALPVPISFVLAIMMGLKKFSLAVLSVDLLFSGWMGVCFAVMFALMHKLNGAPNNRVWKYIFGYLVFFIGGFILIGIIDSYLLRPGI